MSFCFDRGRSVSRKAETLSEVISCMNESLCRHWILKATFFYKKYNT